MSQDVVRFYRDLAENYHMIFADWQQGLRWQGERLDKFIRRQIGENARTLLDCSCGIGTQALGLALRGYSVHATDLSPDAVERAAREAANLGLQMTFGVADIRTLDRDVSGTFDIVLSCDNSWAHMLSDDDLYAAARGMASRLNPGGMLLVSIRDYNALIVEKPTAIEPRIFYTPEGQRIHFQVWDWQEDRYILHHYITQQTGDSWHTTHAVTTLRALQREQISAALSAAGLREIHWHMPETNGYYQPIVTGRRD